VISLDEALAAYPRHLHALEIERSACARAASRVAHVCASGCDLPRFSQSAMDGYAVTMEDAARAALHADHH